MIAFICATPLQIFNAVNIMFHDFPRDKMDIYALTFRTDLKKVLQNMENKHLIHNVFYVDGLLRSNKKFSVVKDYLQIKKTIKQMIPQKTNYYTDLFTTWVGGYGTAIYSCISKKNQVKLHFYEEGIGVYKHRVFDYYRNIKMFYKAIGDKCEADYLDDIYLYAPEIIYKENNYKTKKISAINKKNTDVVNKINSVFGFEKKITYSQSNIYLENYLEPSIYGEYDQTIILEHLDAKNILIRKHPITKTEIYENKHMEIDIYGNIPWELLLMNLEHCEKKTFITILSTAVFSPKMIFDEEPRIVILAKAVSNSLKEGSDYAANYWTREFEELVYRLREKYRQPEKVIIPEKLDEFYEYMDREGKKER